MKLITATLLTFYFATAHAGKFGLQNKLNPVHGLFVKPSEDGVTGDLYVAATEDNGVNSQWLTDHPINFLSTSTSTQSQAASTPVTYTSTITKSTSPQEETVTTKKRAVINSPVMKYAYALPMSGATDVSPFNPYSYGLYASNAHKSDEGSHCQSEGVATHTGLPAYPYPYYYPPMMTALSAAMNALRDDEEDNGAKVPQSAPHQWPGAYAYPYQYIMLGPTAWPQQQTTTSGKETAGKIDSE